MENRDFWCLLNDELKDDNFQNQVSKLHRILDRAKEMFSRKQTFFEGRELITLMVKSECSSIKTSVIIHLI